MRRKISVLTIALLAVMSLSLAALADQTATIGSPATVTAGDSEQFNATFTIVAPVGTGNTSFLVIDPVAGATGTVSLTYVSHTGSATTCANSDTTSITCTWPDGLAVSDQTVVTVSVAASADATGDWEVAAGFSDSDSAPNTIALATIAVAPPASTTTTIAAATTTTGGSTDSTGAPATTTTVAGGTDELPFTGPTSNTTLYVAVGLALLATGTLLVRSRRPEED